MEIAQQLTVDRLEIRHRTEGKYALTLVDPRAWDVKSTLTLQPQDMAHFGLDPSEDLVGAELALTLTVTSYAPEADSPHLLLITELAATEEVQYHYSRVPPDKTTRQTYRLGLRTPVAGPVEYSATSDNSPTEYLFHRAGGTLVVLPPVYHELTLLLASDEYERVKSLPAPTAFELHLRFVPSWTRGRQAGHLHHPHDLSINDSCARLFA